MIPSHMEEFIEGRNESSCDTYDDTLVMQLAPLPWREFRLVSGSQLDDPKIAVAFHGFRPLWS